MAHIGKNIVIIPVFLWAALIGAEQLVFAEGLTQQPARKEERPVGEGPLLSSSRNKIIFEQTCYSREPWAAKLDSEWNTLEWGVTFKIPLARTKMPSLYTRYNCPRPLP